MRVIWSTRALRQIWRAYDYLAELNPKAAIKLAKALVAEGDSLEHFPYKGRPLPGSANRELTVIHPYVIRYEIVQGEVWIVSVRHGARRPD